MHALGSTIITMTLCMHSCVRACVEVIVCHAPPFPGQAGAVRLGLSKALLAFPGRHGEKLEEAGLLVRDPRAVERKKPGQKKARKKFAW